MQDVSKIYESKLVSAEQIADTIKSGMQIYSDIALSNPYAIDMAIGEYVKNKKLTNVRRNTVLDIYQAPCYQPGMPGKMTGISWFSGANARKAVNSGYGDVFPGFYYDYPGIIREDLQIDVFCATVSKMDKHGYFSMGTSGSLSEALLSKAKKIYLEVNENMPRALSAPMIHVSQADLICENSRPLLCVEPEKIDDVSRKIGEIIVDEIPDGATLQLGIGAIPDAVGMGLKSKKNLGIHTEMLTNSMIELIECGAVNNSMKPIHRGKSVATFAMGSQKMYEYIDDNPAVEILPVDYVNDPAIIARHPGFISINAALEVDFYGQVSAESMGTMHISGTGGQLDYVRGATHSRGGKSFIAFPSTAKEGTISRIMPTLKEGSIVSTGKNDVDNIVTEYGIARLRGKSLSERTKALIAIAHPDFRDELTFAAKKQNIIL